MKAKLNTASEADEAQEPFLSATRVHSCDSCATKQRQNWRPRLCWTLTLLYISIFGFMWASGRLRFRTPYKPVVKLADVSLETKQTVFHNLSSGLSNFAGPAPDLSIDKAWGDLLRPMNMRFTEREFRESVQAKSVELLQSGGYLAWLGVFHELHCIKMLRQWTYRAHYHSDKTEAEMEHLARHADHCTEMLRLSSLCHADLSLTAFKWVPESRKPMFDASESVHQCVDWDIFVSSAKQQFISNIEIENLRNPLLET